jgi:hypothetical protein
VRLEPKTAKNGYVLTITNIVQDVKLFSASKPKSSFCIHGYQTLSVVTHVSERRANPILALELAGLKGSRQECYFPKV